jgi:hypothetical protein
MKPTNVDQYIASLPAEHAEIVSELRAVVKKAAPKATEAFKWAQPVYESDGPIVWVKAFTRYVNIGFWRGTELQDKYGLLEGEGDRMRHVKIATRKDIKKGALTDYVKQAVKLNASKGDPTKRMKAK